MVFFAIYRAENKYIILPTPKVDEMIENPAINFHKTAAPAIGNRLALNEAYRAGLIDLLSNF